MNHKTFVTVYVPRSINLCLLKKHPKNSGLKTALDGNCFINP